MGSERRKTAKNILCTKVDTKIRVRGAPKVADSRYNSDDDPYWSVRKV